MSRFDHGKELNMRIYGTVSLSERFVTFGDYLVLQAYPPEYDIRKINSSIYLFYSDFDWLANAKDVEGFLIPMLQSKTLKKAT